MLTPIKEINNENQPRALIFSTKIKKASKAVKAGVRAFITLAVELVIFVIAILKITK